MAFRPREDVARTMLLVYTTITGMLATRVCVCIVLEFVLISIESRSEILFYSGCSGGDRSDEGGVDGGCSCCC
jgi:hypothetical protein